MFKYTVRGFCPDHGPRGVLVKANSAAHAETLVRRQIPGFRVSVTVVGNADALPNMNGTGYL